MKLPHLYLEGGPAPPMTSYICVFHLGIGLACFWDTYFRSEEFDNDCL